MANVRSILNDMLHEGPYARASKQPETCGGREIILKYQTLNKIDCRGTEKLEVDVFV